MLGIVSLAMSLSSAIIFYVLSLLTTDFQIVYSIATVLMCFLSMNNIRSIRDRIRRHRFRVDDERRELRTVTGEIEKEKSHGGH